ncbi:signal peptide peptidase SppA [Croceicoccus sp. F390]|uniref:Signal peptide peptidase SppA n=1 Tax=Croceicoccus esteveae TaxID=3075597 RepID=A0ABU2ZG39_9SPHN|nr:signal peptide peptidase SppA [Croceicoccus sp. F390]MDT0575559.1 signal peptide peptidase SppA [Croceicoccus sp. F390]
MAFARKVWKLLVGIKDGLVLLLLLLFFGLLYAALSYSPKPALVRDGALLVALDGVVVEEPQTIDPLSLLLSSRANVQEHRALDVVRAIEGAASDERIKLVVLDLDYFLGGGSVHLSRIGEAMDKVRAAGKPVLTHAIYYADDAFQLAAHADEVWLDPLGGALVAGPGGTSLYYGDLLERLKVNVHIYRVGTYKSAVEPFERNDQSPAAEQAARALYDSLWTNWQDEVKRARPQAQIDLAASEPARLIEAAGGDPARAALTAGLVDKLGTREAFGAHVAGIAGPDPVLTEMPGAYAHTAYDAWLAANPLENDGAAIGVVTIAGEIVDGKAGPGAAGGESIAALLDEALDDELAALVVRVDSPGGSVLASEQIRQAILRHKAKGIPIVVSMANVAASGGYWVATPAEAIFAEPSTITGSIGVFAVVPTLEDSLGAIGINADGVQTTVLSGQPDILGGFTPELERVMQAQIEGVYGRFLSLVATSRGLPLQRVAPVAEGRVWAGGTARQLGLVDRFGGLEEAVAYAAGRAELKEGAYHTRFLAPEPDFLTSLFVDMAAPEKQSRRGGGADLFAHLAAGRSAMVSRIAADTNRLFATPGVQARCMECPVALRAPEIGGAAPQMWGATVQGSYMMQIARMLFAAG